jgi:8-oxo-dGTP pyrophosphatase MutT (NUDIX family)
MWWTEPNRLFLSCLPWNRWSGHVAYIGGKNEAGETDLDTVTREVQEESGLDLASDAFLQLGRLDDRELISTYNKQLMMILIPFGKFT